MPITETYIAITVTSFTRISVCYTVSENAIVTTYSEKIENNFARAMLRAMELRDTYRSTHIKYRIWAPIHTVVRNDEEAYEAIITAKQW